MNVTADNFDAAATELERLLPSCAFYAIDEEMTGIMLNKETAPSVGDVCERARVTRAGSASLRTRSPTRAVNCWAKRWRAIGRREAKNAHNLNHFGNHRVRNVGR